jgi:hypothetical protein
VNFNMNMEQYRLSRRIRELRKRPANVVDFQEIRTLNEELEKWKESQDKNKD